MKKKQKQMQDNRPVFIEVPKPVNQMSKKEKDDFIHEILDALEGKDK